MRVANRRTGHVHHMPARPQPRRSGGTPGSPGAPRARTAGALAALACVCGLLASGCGAASVSSVIDPVAKAATVSNSAAGLRMNLSMQISSPALPSAITASGSGRFSPAARTGSFNLATNLGSIPGIAQLLGSSSLDVQELLNGDTVYVKLPSALSSRLPGAHTPWMELNLAKAASGAGIPGLSSLMGNPASSNPAAMLQYLRSTSGGVTKLGADTIGGLATTHYRATIDLQKYPSMLPAAQRAAAHQAIAALQRQIKLQAIPVNVWIDQHQLVRRMTFNLGEQLPGTGQQLQIGMTLDIPEYGPQPSPSFPPPNQVTNISSLAGLPGGTA